MSLGYFLLFNVAAFSAETEWRRLRPLVDRPLRSHAEAVPHLDIPELTLASYESITATAAYAAMSFEELRWLECDPDSSLALPLCRRLFSSTLVVFGGSLIALHPLLHVESALYREFDLTTGAHVRDALVAADPHFPASPLSLTPSLPRLLSAIADREAISPLISAFHALASAPVSSHARLSDEQHIRSAVVFLAHLRGSTVPCHLVFMFLTLRLLAVMLGSVSVLCPALRKAVVTLLFRIALAPPKAPSDTALSRAIRCSATTVATMSCLYPRPEVRGHLLSALPHSHSGLRHGAHATAALSPRDHAAANECLCISVVGVGLDGLCFHTSRLQEPTAPPPRGPHSPRMCRAGRL